jgi:hypothetical protein
LNQRQLRHSFDLLQSTHDGNSISIARSQDEPIREELASHP